MVWQSKEEEMFNFGQWTRTVEGLGDGLEKRGVFLFRGRQRGRFIKANLRGLRRDLANQSPGRR
jgi:hypothetical protein